MTLPLAEHERRLRIAVAREREACAQVVDDERARSGDRWGLEALYLRQAARRIRERGEGPSPSCSDVTPEWGEGDV